MKRRAVCFLLCLCFCFCSVSLKSSAVDDYQSQEDVINSNLYPMSTFNLTRVNYPSFDINSVPWHKFPDYIQEIVYTSLSGLYADSNNTYSVPFVLIKVWSDQIWIYAGRNISILGYVPSSGVFVPSYYRLGYLEPSMGYSQNNICYFSSFDYNFNTITDWSVPDVRSWGYCSYYINGSQISSSHTCDFYFYGSNGLIFDPDHEPFYLPAIPFNNNDGAPYLCTVVHNTGAGASSVIGYGSYYGFYGHGISVNGVPTDISNSFPNISIQPFVPLTPEQIEIQIDEERNELIEEGNKTSKGIWETLKGIPEAIGEKIKGLFVPSEGFFDTCQQEFQTYFKDRFGILYEIPELVINLLQKFVTFNPKEDDYSITFPEVKLPVLEDGEWREEKLIETQEFSFDFVNEAPFSLLYDAYVAFIWLVYIMLLINLIKNKANGVFKGG